MLRTGGTLTRLAERPCRHRSPLVGPGVNPAEPFPRHPPQGAARSSDTPLFNEMAASWTALGRTVPGNPDPEWDRLVSLRPRPRRRRLLLPNPRQTGP